MAAVAAAGATDEFYYTTDTIEYALGKCEPDYDDTCEESALEYGSAEELIAWARDVCLVIKRGGVPQYPDDNRPGMLPAEFLHDDLEVGVKDPLDPGAATRAVLAIKILCPKYIKYVAQAKSGKYPTAGPMTSFTDGDFAVGKDIAPGTYRTQPGIEDCYWERSSRNGETLANDFVNFAANGAVVTIRSSDGGFSSDGCGLWKRI